MCSVFFHTNFIEISNRMLFTRKEIDGANKDNQGKHFLPDFCLDLVFKQIKVLSKHKQRKKNERCIILIFVLVAKEKTIHRRDNGESGVPRFAADIHD